MNGTAKEKKGLQNILSAIGGEKLVLMGAIVIVFILFSSLNSNFFSMTNIVNLLVAASLVGLVAIGHTYLIIAAQNDLSPGSLAALSGTLCALLVSWKIPLVVSILITLAVAALVGVCNALMVNKIKLDPFIATLVSQAILRGFAYIICDGKPVAISDPAFIEIGKARFLGIPVSVWIMIISIAIFGFILAKNKIRPQHLRHRRKQRCRASCRFEPRKNHYHLLYYDGTVLRHWRNCVCRQNEQRPARCKCQP